MRTLVVGTVYRCRYDTQTAGSTPGTGARRIKIIEGPHHNPRFKHGQILRVRDLTDPDEPGKEKTFYVHRFLQRIEEEDVWAKRNRYDRRQPGARRVQRSGRGCDCASHLR